MALSPESRVRCFVRCKAETLWDGSREAAWAGLVGVLALGTPVTVLTEGLSSRVPSITTDWISKLIISAWNDTEHLLKTAGTIICRGEALAFIFFSYFACFPSLVF